MKKFLVAEAADAGKRLDSFLASYLNISRSSAQNLCDRKLAMRPEDGQAVKKSLIVSEGESFEVELTEPKPLELTPLDIPLDIVYEDSDIIIINKPRGLVVHPAAGHSEDTLVNALIAHCGDSLSGINGELRPGIVHRIDKDTSGLLVVAKNDLAHISLSEQIKEHSARRRYIAIVKGNLREDSGSVDAPIGRDQRDRKKMSVTSVNSRNAVTDWDVIRRFSGRKGSWTFIRCSLHTGRTHQIRVHMAHLGHPVAGDPLYGGKDELSVGGQCLHAYELELTHPRTGERMTFSASLPDYFEKVLSLLTNSEL